MYPRIDNPQNYTAALYLRLSKEDDKKGDEKSSSDSESIKNQRVMLEEYAHSEKLNVYDVYIDDGYSGTSFKRPDFERMISDIESKKVNMVITKDMSRLGRDYIAVGQYMELYFPENNVRYISLLDGIDTGCDNYNNDITPFKAIMNDMYAKDISKKISSVKRDKQSKGLFIGGKASFGYKKSPTEKNVIIIDEPAAEIVRNIFQLALEGKSCREIAMILNEQNIPTPAAYAGINLSVKGPYSGKWSSERISFMLQNEVYLGSMVQGRVKKVNYKSKKCIKLPREEWTVVEKTHEPLVDRESFEKVAMLIKSRNQTRSRTYDYLLKGIIFCHECGYPLGVINRTLSGNRQTLYFLCRTYQRFTEYKTCTCHCVRVESVTEAVLREVREICKQYISRLDLDELTGAARKKMLAEKKQQEKDVIDIKAKLEATKSKIDKTYNDRLSSAIDEDLFQRTYKRLKKEEAILQKKALMLERSKKENEIDVNKVKELVDSFLNAKEYSREVIVSLIERIELTEKKEVLIYFKFKELDSSYHL
ncbi:MAG: recombinase family protein [Bacillota bacterium]|nr:recombinase family protein [Bacillota bacterium]